MMLGKPVIVVAMNYRMHLLGLVGCRELCDEARSAGDTGYYNLGLHDQRLAFEWISRYIRYFGGSEDQVTAMGESAGGQSILWHMHSDKPIFNRAIVHSSPFHQPVTRADHQKQWEALFTKLGLDPDAPRAVKLAAARSLPIDQLVDAHDASTPAFPCVDDGFLKGYTPDTVGEASYWGRLPYWLDSAVICVMKEEGSFCLPTYVSAQSPVLRDAIIQASGPSQPAQSFAAEIAHAYGISPQVMDQATSFYAFQKFVGDGFFVCHAVETAREIAKHHQRIFFAFFDKCDEDKPKLSWLKENTWAYHGFDVIFMFHDPQTWERKSYRRVADDITQAYTTFAYGQDPWESLAAQGQCAVYSSQGLHLESLQDRVKEADGLRTTPKRRDMFRQIAYALHLDIFENAAEKRGKKMAASEAVGAVETTEAAV
jgi:carboxylesterase type B